jgi:biopolymer transport protein ExbD
MRKIVRGAPRRPPLGFIILPMIDVIFLLLLFFVIMAGFDASTRIHVQLPHPVGSEARRDSSSNRVVVNCELAEAVTDAARYRIGADPPLPLDEIAKRLVLAKNADVASLHIRADRRLPFSKVRDVLAVAAQVGFENVSVAALQEEAP